MVCLKSGSKQSSRSKSKDRVKKYGIATRAQPSSSMWLNILEGYVWYGEGCGISFYGLSFNFLERKSMNKTELSAQATKNEFVKSIHNWLMKTLQRYNKEEYSDCFVIEGSSIMCTLPSNYFDLYTIPEGIKIEMKFVVKKG